MRNGASLIELLIVLSILGIFAAILIPSCGGCVTTDARKADGERNAHAFADSMSLPVKGVSCSGSDSDNDGYTSCTLAMEDGTTRAIECGYDQPIAPLGQNTGCRMALPGNFVQQGQ